MIVPLLAVAVLVAQVADAPVAAEAPDAAPAVVVAPTTPAPAPGGKMLYGGGIALGVAYLPMAAMATESLRFGHGQGAVLFIPIAGPFISALIESRRSAHPYLITLLVADGIVQTAGAALAFIGWRQRSAPAVALSAGPIAGDGFMVSASVLAW